MEFFRQEYWAFPPPGNLPHPGINLRSSASPALAGGFLSPCATWEAPDITISYAYLQLACLHIYIYIYTHTYILQTTCINFSFLIIHIIDSEVCVEETIGLFFH